MNVYCDNIVITIGYKNRNINNLYFCVYFICSLLVLLLFTIVHVHICSSYGWLSGIYCSDSLSTASNQAPSESNFNCNNNNSNHDNSEQSLSEFYDSLDNIQELWSITADPTNVTTVYNLSSYQLSEAEKSLLEKGLKFCPTPPKPDVGDIFHDVDNFFRSANLKLFFSDFENAQTNTTQGVDQTQPFEHPNLKLKSKFNPTLPPLLEFVRQSVLSDLQNFSPKPSRSKNLTHDQFLAIKSLSQNHNIVIKPADKGSGIVVMNREDYIKEGECQLHDEKFYQKVDHDLTSEHFAKVKTLVDKMFDQEEITEKTRNYLLTNSERTSQFYMLPKIHKILSHLQVGLSLPVMTLQQKKYHSW